MSWLVVSSIDEHRCRLQVIDGGSPMVPTDTTCWYLDQPHLMERVIRRLKHSYVGGSLHAPKGAMYLAPVSDVVAIVKSVLGPSNEELKQQDHKMPIWVIALLGLSGLVFALGWLWLKTLMLIALVPIIFLAFGRIFR